MSTIHKPVVWFLTLALTLSLTLSPSASTSAAPLDAIPMAGLQKAPVMFIENVSQFDPSLSLGQESGVAQAHDTGSNVWTSNGPEGGEIYTLAIDPATPTILYAGTINGVFKSTNGGGTWSIANTGLTGASIYGYPIASVLALAIDPATPTTIYAGTMYGGVFKSTDAGGNWSRVTNGGLTDRSVSILAIDPLTPSTLYAATSSGVFKSTNSGGIWEAVNTGLTDTQISTLTLDPVTPTTLYAGTNNSGVFKSTNGGGNWSTVNTGPNCCVKTLVIDPITPMRGQKVAVCTRVRTAAGTGKRSTPA